ncbi:MAG: hypothetical protein AAGI52_15270 [Bacteroidota bacterium]
MNPLSRPADTATLRLDFPEDGPEADVPEPVVKPEPAGDPWDFCPNCGSRLHNERCKRRCPRCHYFMSCSDFD